jgi:hypothetical protein
VREPAVTRWPSTRPPWSRSRRSVTPEGSVQRRASGRARRSRRPFDEVLERPLEAAGRVVVLEGAAVREDVAQDAVLGVVDLASGERERAARGGERPRGCDDAATGVVGELDAAGVVVDARELAAGERAAAVVVVADLADLRARGL